LVFEFFIISPSYEHSSRSSLAIKIFIIGYSENKKEKMIKAETLVYQEI